jgi:hypothetical protein
LSADVCAFCSQFSPLKNSVYRNGGICSISLIGSRIPVEAGDDVVDLSPDEVGFSLATME